MSSAAPASTTAPLAAASPALRKASQMPGAQRIGRRLTAAGPKRILAIDGGGTRGIVAIRFLAEIERTLQSKLGRGDDFVLSDYFDLVGGTSVGALIATLVARGWRVSRIEELFGDFANDIFDSKARRIVHRAEALTGRRLRWLIAARDGLRLMLSQDKYEADALERRIADIVGAEPMASDKLLTGLAVICKRADTNSVWIVTNNPHARYFDDAENTRGITTIGNGFYEIADVLRASTAAPTIFRPVDIKIHDARDHGVVPSAPGRFIDGGVSPHNSPALQLFLMAALSKYNLGGPNTAWRIRRNSLLLVSVGTGSFDVPVGSGHLAWRAIDALRGIITDGTQLGTTVLQAMSEPRQPWWIDSELRDMKRSSIAGLRGLSFQRYDLPLDKKWLLDGNLRTGIARGHHASIACLRYPGSFERDITELTALDAPEMIGKLAILATAAARDQVSVDDFPDAFDRVWVDPERAAAPVASGGGGS